VDKVLTSALQSVAGGGDAALGSVDAATATVLADPVAVVAASIVEGHLVN
jgi:hypothetical protein